MDFSEALQLFYIHEILLITWKMPIFWRSIMLSDIWFMVNSYIHSLLNHAFTFLTDYHTFPLLSFLLPPRYQRESEQIWGRIQNLRIELPTLCVYFGMAIRFKFSVQSAPPPPLSWELESSGNKKGEKISQIEKKRKHQQSMNKVIFI